MNRPYRLLWESVSFGLVGICATLTYIVASLAAESEGANTYGASFVGYVASVGVSYIGHSSITFPTTQSHLVKGPKFLSVTLLVFVLTNFIVFVMTELLAQSFFHATIAVAVAIPALTWMLSKYWVFRSQA